MPSRFDKHCIMCGAHYKYCAHCDDYKGMEPWHESFDNDNCHTIFNTVMEYRTGYKTPAESKKIMEGCDLSYRNKFSDGMNAFITTILSEGENIVDEPETVEETVEDVTEETEIKDEIYEENVEKQNNNYKKYSSNKKKK